MGQDITFAQPDGGQATGYIAESGAGAPGVVLIQEWWGLIDQIKGMCDKLAGEGYNVLAPDLYSGTAIEYHDLDGAAREMNSLDFLGATDQMVRGAAQHLGRGGAKVGLTGYCLGGAVTIIGAVRVPEIAAAVCFYGIPPVEAADPKDISIPFQGHFANTDDWCNPPAVDALEASLAESDSDYEIFRYDGQHAFLNHERPDVYDAAIADQSWVRTLEFWGRHLGG
ncbi:MAG: dienelactone hydrolase family protein [Alphaproteobacteria bacterium]|jgi:carboxymethylenebutenolidase